MLSLPPSKIAAKSYTKAGIDVSRSRLILLFFLPFVKYFVAYCLQKQIFANTLSSLHQYFLPVFIKPQLSNIIYNFDALTKFFDENIN